MGGGGTHKAPAAAREKRERERALAEWRGCAPSALPPLPLCTPTLPPPPPAFAAQAKFFGTAVAIAKAHKAECDKKGLKKIVEFRASLQDGDNNTWPEALRALKAQVLSFARSFPVVGFDEKTAKY